MKATGTDSIDFAKDLLKKSGLKSTATRVDLINLIHDYGSAIPFSLIQSHFESTDRITVYRTIQTLEQKGLIHKAFANKSKTYYALCDHHCTSAEHYHDHVHFQCTVCDTVSCEDLPNQIAIELPDFQIEKINVHLTGVCKACA